MVAVWMAVVGLVASLASPVIFIPWLRRLGAVDVPNSRSSHVVPTVRGAGLAPAAGVAGALLVALVIQPGTTLLLVLLGSALLAAALGFVEDIRGLPVRIRLVAQIGIGGGFGAVACGVTARSWWLVPLIALAVAAYVNATNFMDGIDGISVGHGLVGGLHFVALGLVLSQPWLVAAGAVLAATFVGFAPWNLLPGRVFLGDVGSYLLGALGAGCAVGAFLVGSHVLLVVAPALPYLADTFSTAVVRARRGEHLAAAHRSHTYQRLIQLGLSHVRSAGIVALCSVLCSVAAFFARLGPWQTTTAVLVIGLVLAVYLLLPRLLSASAPKVQPA